MKKLILGLIFLLPVVIAFPESPSLLRPQELAQLRRTGGPALPTFRHDGSALKPHTDGLTLRDYFASAYVTGRLAGGYRHPGQTAEEAYALADAMLIRRQR